MKFDIRIEEQLEEIWEQLGLSEEEQDEYFHDLNAQVRDFFKNYIKSLYDHVQQVKEDAEITEHEVEEHIRRFDITVNGSLDKSLPYLHRLRNAKKRLNALQQSTARQQAEFDETYNTLAQCYEKLEITPPTSFSSKEMSCGIDKIDQMNEMIDQYNNEIDQRQEKVDDYINELTLVNRDLGLPPEPAPENLGDQTIANLEQLLNDRREKRELNCEDVHALTTEIKRLERVLGTRQQTSTNITVFSDAIVNKLKERLVYLDQEKEERLPDFVEAMKVELQELLEDLHIPMPSKAEFPFLYQKTPNKRALKALESEVARLEKVKRQVAPLLSLIAKRQNILNLQRGTDTGSTRGRAVGDLSRIHAEMIVELEKYEATYGEPFLWDGEDLLEEVQRMHKAEKASTIRAKQTQSRQKTRPRPQNMTQREPFYLQQFM